MQLGLLVKVGSSCPCTQHLCSLDDCSELLGWLAFQKWVAPTDACIRIAVLPPNIVHHIRYQHTTANVCVPAQNWNWHGAEVVHWWTSQFNHTMQSSTQFDIHRPQPCTVLSCSWQDLKLIPYSLEASVVSSSSNMLQWCWCLSNVLKSNSLSENCMKFTFAW